jgi:hypothetical protein
MMRYGLASFFAPQLSPAQPSRSFFGEACELPVA